MQHKLIVVSMDAMIFEDLSYLSQKPNFKWLLDNGASVRNLRSIYPTLTYPCHATMATGCYPAKHGVINNKMLIPGNAQPPWCWYHDVFCVKDIMDAAKETGLTTACFGWPSFGNHPSVDYLVSEIAHTTAQSEEEFYADYLRTGTSKELWETMCKPHIHWRTEAKKVQMFNTAVCCDVIRNFSPDLTLMHLANPDKARHDYGAHAKQVEDALDECDQVLGMLRQAIEDSQSPETYNLVITSDHGQLDINRFANPNVLFVEEGLITLDGSGNMTDWRAWCFGTGLSATVFVKDPADESVVFSLLNKHIGEGYSRIYSREEAAAEGYAGGFAFMLETDGKTEFRDNFCGEYYKPLKAVRGSHGHYPDKGPQPVFLGIGPAFIKGAVHEFGKLVDGAPTYAKILNVNLPDTDGNAWTDILKQGDIL